MRRWHLYLIRKRRNACLHRRAEAITANGLSLVPALMEFLSTYLRMMYSCVLKGDYLLDIGCGVGRWGDTLVPKLKTGKYVGIDYTQDFIKIAKENFSTENTKFICGSFQNLKEILERENELWKYDKILINGVLMYINDEDIDSCLSGIR